MTHFGKILGLIWVECSSHGGAWRETGVYMGIKKRERKREEEKTKLFAIDAVHSPGGQVIRLLTASSRGR